MVQISIIIPVFQAEKTIAHCIDSILAQSFSDFEIILLNDGSTDASGSICEHYACQDSRITVIHQKNMGVSATRNKGIALAKGKYIMFCDSDDYVASDWCRKLYEKIEVHPRHMISCHSIRVDVDGKEQQIKQAKSFSTKSYYKFWRSHLSAYTVTKIYDRELLQQHSIRFRDNIHFAEDVAFNVDYFRVCNGVIVISDALYYYCDNPSSLMHRRYDDFFSVYAFPFQVRFPLIEEEYRGDFCDVFLSDFIGMLSYVFERKDMNFLQKLRFNQRIVCHDLFQLCLNHANGNNESPLVLKILRCKNYYAYWGLMNIIKIKQKLFPYKSFRHN